MASEEQVPVEEDPPSSQEEDFAVDTPFLVYKKRKIEDLDRDKTLLAFVNDIEGLLHRKNDGVFVQFLEEALNLAIKLKGQ